MASTRKVIEVLRPVYNEQEEQLDTEGNVMGSDKKKVQEPMMKPVKYYLLHWGVQSDIVYSEGNPIVYSDTVGICQHIETGHIQTFLPTEIRIIGVEKT
jgi:hypothetical protein